MTARLATSKQGVPRKAASEHQTKEAPLVRSLKREATEVQPT